MEGCLVHWKVSDRLFYLTDRSCKCADDINKGFGDVSSLLHGSEM